MRVKAGLTNDSLDQRSDPQPDPREDINFNALATLFASDPLVAYEPSIGWYISATALDDADARDSVTLRQTLDALVAHVNGIHRLLGQTNYVIPARPTYAFEGNQSGVQSMLYNVTVTSVSVDGLEPRAASALLELADEQPEVGMVLELLGRLERRWFWLDAYRVWEVVRSVRNGGISLAEWLRDQGEDLVRLEADFQESANNPEYWGERRHANHNYKPRKRGDGTTREAISQDDAEDFLKRIVIGWIDTSFNSQARPQSV